MLNKRLVSFSCLSALLLSISSTAIAEYKPIPEEELKTTREMQADLFRAAHYLNKKHYLSVELNDQLSSQILSSYIDSLDPNKQYFYAQDIEDFKKYEFEIDDQFKNGNLNLGFYIYIYFRNRVLEREKYVQTLLESELDFSKDEYYTIDRADSPWPTTQQEMNDIWRKRIKNQILIQQSPHIPIELISFGRTSLKKCSNYF